MAVVECTDFGCTCVACGATEDFVRTYNRHHHGCEREALAAVLAEAALDEAEPLDDEFNVPWGG